MHQKILLIFKSVIPTGDLALFNRHTRTLVGKFARVTDPKFQGNLKVSNGKNYLHPKKSPIFLNWSPSFWTSHRWGRKKWVLPDFISTSPTIQSETWLKRLERDFSLIHCQSMFNSDRANQFATPFFEFAKVSPNLVVLNLVARNFYAEALFCALLRPFALFCALSRT